MATFAPTSSTAFLSSVVVHPQYAHQPSSSSGLSMLTRSRSGLVTVVLLLVGFGAPAPTKEGGSLAGNVSLRVSSIRCSRRYMACSSCSLFIKGEHLRPAMVPDADHA